MSRYAFASAVFCALLLNGFATVGRTEAPKVDPTAVGMWKLAQPGFDMYWQIRADGTYRYFGVNARPFEHWGTIEIAGGTWATRWVGGQDGGSYTMNGSSWQQTGKAGTGNWQRIWKPGDGGSQAPGCTLIDLAEVERVFGGATQGRGDQQRCELRRSGIGSADVLTILLVENASQRYLNVRQQHGKMRPVVDVPGLATAAFIDGDSLYVLKGGRYAVLEVEMHPARPDAVSNADLVSLGRSLVQRM